MLGTLNKWNDEKKAWYPRLCVGWRPETESHFVLEFSPHMGEKDLGKIDLRGVQIRDLNTDETKEGEIRPFSFTVTLGSTNHIFSVRVECAVVYPSLQFRTHFFFNNSTTGRQRNGEEKMVARIERNERRIFG